MVLVASTMTQTRGGFVEAGDDACGAPSGVGRTEHVDAGGGQRQRKSPEKSRYCQHEGSEEAVTRRKNSTKT